MSALSNMTGLAPVMDTTSIATHSKSPCFCANILDRLVGRDASYLNLHGICL
jgi:Na+/proline symporter